MRNRLIVGGFRYGRLGQHGKPNYDRIGSIEARLDLYRLFGNQEHLVDIANLALCEFVEGVHPQQRFESISSHNHHTETRHENH